MHNTRLSIFILPVLIIGLSVFTTFVEENPSFRALFQISQVANPSVNDESESIIEEAQSERNEDISSDPAQDEAVSTEHELTSEEIREITENAQPDDQETPRDESNQSSEQSTDTVSEDTPADTTESSQDTPQEEVLNENQEVPLETEEQTDQEIKDAEALALKVAQFEVSRKNISYRFQLNLARLEDARDSLAEKITLMEQEGKDTTQAKNALLNLDEAIRNSRHYIKDSTVPDSVPGIQRLLSEYVKNARDSIQQGYTALFDAIKEAQ